MWELFKFDMICSHFLSFERDGRCFWDIPPQPIKAGEPFERLQGRWNVWAEARGLKVFEPLHGGDKQPQNNHPPPLHLPTHPSVQTIPLLSNGRWDVVRLHSRMTLSCCVGQTGNEEDCRWRQVAIQSEAAVSVSIKLLHLAWPARWRQEARLWMKGGGGGGSLFSMSSQWKTGRNIKSRRAEKESICVFPSLCFMCLIKKEIMHRIWAGLP